MVNFSVFGIDVIIKCTFFLKKNLNLKEKNEKF